ncbi:MAG: ABC transporter permease [Fimbriimonadaceae bacterium]|nr:ABC transporter permease [Fimbriimonadaceae bacterium]
MRQALQVLNKEWIELRRDRRVIMNVFVLPVFMMLMFGYLFGTLEEKLGKEPDLTVHVVGDMANPVVKRMMEGEKKAKVVASTDLEASIEKIKKGDVRMVVEVPADYAQRVAVGKGLLKAHYDKNAPLGNIAFGLLTRAAENENAHLVESLVVASGKDKSLAKPVNIESIDANPQTGLGASPLASLLPYLVVLFCFTSGMAGAADMVAGEKERGTLETLLVSPVDRNQVAAGKFLALFLTCLAGSVVALVAVVAVGALGLPATKAIFPTGVSLSPVAVFVLVAVIVPLAAMFAGLMLAVSTHAKTMREAGTLLGLMNLAVIAPAVLSQVVGIAGMDKAAWVRWTPVLNNAIALKGGLAGNVDWAIVGTAVLTSGVLAALAIALSVRLFQREQVLARV